MTENAIEIRGLVKRYGSLTAVNGISLDVKSGSFFAFLGPNGAGKSTTISIISTLKRNDGGKVKIFGKSIDDPSVRSMIGIVFQEHRLNERMTVRENLRFIGTLYGIGKDEIGCRMEELMRMTGCTRFADRLYGSLSGGQKRRADIARALIHRPKLLILDEPTSGLDPQSRSAIWDFIRNLNRDNGMTVFLTTHYMEEAAIADDIVIIKKGEVRVRGTPEEIKDRYCVDRLDMVAKDSGEMAKALASMGAEYSIRDGRFSVKLNRTTDSIPLIERLRDNISFYEVKAGTLDEAFIAVTGETE